MYLRQVQLPIQNPISGFFFLLGNLTLQKDLGLYSDIIAKAEREFKISNFSFPALSLPAGVGDSTNSSGQGSER